MIHGGREFSDIYDLVGIRILVDSDPECYGVLGVLHNRWNPLPGRFKDYVAMPKFNMYQSLHTTVIGPSGKPVEMQIRTVGDAPPRGVRRRRALEVQGGRARRRRQPPSAADVRHAVAAPAARLAERGRGPGGVPGLAALRDQQRRGLRVHPARRRDRAADRLDARSTSPTPSTPRSVTTPSARGSTAGWCRWSPRSSTATSSRCSPPSRPTPVRRATGCSSSSRPRARSKIRHWFTKERREEAIEQGKEQIGRLLRKEGLPLKRVMTHDSLTQVANELRLPDVSALYAAVGEGNLGAQTVVRKVIEVSGGEEGAAEDLAEAVTITRPRRRRRPGQDSGIVVKGVSDVLVKLARCCTPVPGDEILGFVTRGDGISVHRRDCTNATSLLSQPERLVDVEWAPTSQSTFLVQIMVEALDRARLLSDITMVLSDQHVNILSASLSTSRDRVAKSRFAFEMGDPKHLGAILKSVRQVDGVFDAYRVTH